MEAAYISALAALAGSAIGGLTTFATSWTTQQAQARAQRLANEREKREGLFGKFLDEAAKLYADAMQNKREDAPAVMIGIHALTNRIRLSSSARVVEKADAITEIIMDTYLSPNMTVEVRNKWIEQRIDPLRDFSEACREELQIFGKFRFNHIAADTGPDNGCQDGRNGRRHQPFPGGRRTPAIRPVPAVRPTVAIRPSDTIAVPSATGRSRTPCGPSGWPGERKKCARKRSMEPRGPRANCGRLCGPR
jgi:hypothetical protein